MSNTYVNLNAELNLYSPEGKLQLEKDHEAARAYFLEHVNVNTRFFHDIEEKIEYLTSNDFWDKNTLDAYDPEFVKKAFKHAYDKKFRFPSFMGAYKFYTSYALKSNDGKTILERYEDRVVMCALHLGRGDKKLAISLIDEMISGRYQPATPTFQNAGKSRGGELVSCFEGDALVDTMYGPTPISQIIEGDLVLTHDGTYREVKGITVRNSDDCIVSVKVSGNPDRLRATQEHPVLMKRGKKNPPLKSHKLTNDGAVGDIQWASIKDVLPGDYLVASVPKIDNMISSIRVEDYLTGYNRDFVIDNGFVKVPLKDKKTIKRNKTLHNAQITHIKNEIKLNEDFGRFIGYYLAEGYIHYSAGSLKGVRFTFGKTETSFIEDVKSLSQSIFGVKPVYNDNKDGSCTIAVWSGAVGLFIKNLVGSGFNKKLITDVLLSTEPDFLNGILLGCFRGDGCTTNSKVVLDMSNPSLMRQLRTIAMRIGLSPYLRDYISQSGSPTSTLSIAAITEENVDFIHQMNKNIHKFTKNKNTGLEEKFAQKNNDYQLYRVTEVGIEDHSGLVYNLEVEQNHTYSVNGLVVHNCFLLNTSDSLDSIQSTWNYSAQLSKIGGGVAICLTNLRERGAPLKGKDGLAKGVISWMKIYEDIFSTVDQLGTRPGAGAVYLSVHHPDIIEFLDCKRENADEKMRIKTLSTGIVIPDITFELAKNNEDMYLFSPYDVQKEYNMPFSEINITEKYHEMVDNPNISKKKTNARKLLQLIAELQFESGYPYMLFADTANRANPVQGTISMSNLCSEILQTSAPTVFDDATGEIVEAGRDISCNLGSLNVYNAMQSPDFAKTIDTSMRALTAVSDMTDIHRVPTVKKANDQMHSVGLGAMSLATFFATHEMYYGDEESLDFTNNYFMTVNYHTLLTSCKIAQERKVTFEGFKESKYYDGTYFDQYLSGDEIKPQTEKVRKIFENSSVHVPTQQDWLELKERVHKHGLWHAWRMATAPTGSISYINYASPSILPVTSLIEIRKEGALGRVYAPAPHLNEENKKYYIDAYQAGPEKIIDVYAEATKHSDQGLSCTLHFLETATTRDLNKAQLYAWRKGLKTLYYSRFRNVDSFGGKLNVEECVSCSI